MAFFSMRRVGEGGGGRMRLKGAERVGRRGRGSRRGLGRRWVMVGYLRCTERGMVGAAEKRIGRVEVILR